jgi:hypothetical protein
MAKATDRINLQIAAMKRQLSSETLKELRSAAKKLNVTVDSLIWLMTPVYSSGHSRSHAYSDCPEHVIEDGLVVERLGSGFAYTPWMMTEKAKEIVAKTY